MPQSVIRIHNFQLANHTPLVAIAGVNVLESPELVHQVAQHCVNIADSLGFSLIFKGSFDKANRSSIESFRGPGMEFGLKLLEDIANKYKVPTITDLHESFQAQAVAEVVDIIQLPAFLSRQTDLVIAMAKTGKPIHVKKAQFLAPHEMCHIVAKCEQAGNNQVILCERGTMFGYNNLVVDFLGFDTLKQSGCPVTFDVTHALQLPGAGSHSALGRGKQALELASAAVVQKIAGIFIEMHPDPQLAKCDGPSALHMQDFADFMQQLLALDALVKQRHLSDGR